MCRECFLSFVQKDFFLPHRPRLHALWYSTIIKMLKKKFVLLLWDSWNALQERGLSHRPISIYKGIMVPHTCFTGRLDSNSHQLRSTLGVSELHNITYVAIFYRFHLPIRIRSSNQCHGSSSYASINQVSLLVLSFTETKRAIVHEAIQLFDSHIIYMLFESNGISP